MTSDEVEKMDESVNRANIISKQGEYVEDLSSWLAQGGHSHPTSTPCIPANKSPRRVESCDSGFGPSPWGALSQPKSQSFDSRECRSCGSLNDTSTHISSQAPINLFSQFEEKAGFEIAKPTFESRGRRRLTKRRSLQEIGTPSPFRSKRPLSLDLEFDSGLTVTTESSTRGFETSVQYRSSFETSKEKCLALTEPDLAQTSKPVGAQALEGFTLDKSKDLVSSPLKVPSSGLVAHDVCDPPSFSSSRKNVHRPVMKPRHTTFEERFAQRKMTLDREIGNRIGAEYVDVLGELRRREFYEPISLLLSYLSEEDLCRVCLVSSRWKSALDFDSKARRRREKYLSDKRLLMAETPQENRAQAKKLTRKTSFTASNQPMTVIQAVGSSSVAKSTTASITKDDLFRKEAQSLSQHEALRKCPRCDSPARANLQDHRAVCTRHSCRFEFCISCRMSLHPGRDCVVQIRRPVEPKIGSKLSRQNLRRL